MLRLIKERVEAAKQILEVLIFVEPLKSGGV